MDKIKLSWLAGWMEADGSISIFRHKRESGKDRLSVTITATNNDPNLINEIDRITRSFGVKMHLFTRNHENSKHARSYQLTIRNFKDCYAFLQHTVPYMKGNKRGIGCLTMRFLESRLKRIEKLSTNARNTPLENRIMETVKKMNKKGVNKKLKTSETKRNPLIKGEDIVRT